MARKRRKNTNCLNCNHSFTDGHPNDYCPVCGQENTTKKLSFGQLFVDFLGDTFSFDSKIFRSLFPLVFKPGFLTKEFSEGKRIRYIPPLRMYLFMSLVYFTVFSTLLPDKLKLETGFSQNEIDSLILHPEKFTDSLNVIVDTLQQRIEKRDSTQTLHLNFGNTDGTQDNISFSKIQHIVRLARKYNADVVVDSLKKENDVLASNEWMALSTKQMVRIYQSGGRDFFTYFLSLLPVMMLLMMPLLALILKLLYMVKKRYFIEHINFCFHLHAFIYLLITGLILSIHFLPAWTLALLIPVSFIYLFFALKRFYQQGVLLTFLKQMVFAFCYPACLFVFLLVTLSISFILF